MRRPPAAFAALLLASGWVLLASGCATAPSAPGPAPEAMSPRERESLILVEIERSKKQEEGAVRRLSEEARKGGQAFLAAQEEEARNRSIELYRSLLVQYPDTRADFMAEAAFRQAELLFVSERERIRALLDKEGAAAEVKPDFSRAIEVYRLVTERFPRHPLAEDAYYGLAYCYTEQGEPDAAAEGYTRLIELYPDTRYAAEIHMRLGEYFFKLEKLEPAIRHFQAAADRGNADYVEKALYMLGWCHYNQDRFGDAVEDFFRVLDFNRGKTISKGGLVLESLDIIAKCYAESGGTPALARRLASRGRDEFSGALIARLADLYKDRSLYPEAAGTYRLYLQGYPAGAELPRVLANLKECYSVRGDTISALEVVESMPRLLGPASPWYQAADAESRGRMIKDVRAALEEASDRRRARAQAGGSRTELEKALADLVASTAFAGGKPACRVRYVTGVILSELEETEKAAREWMSLASEPDCSEWAARSAMEAVDILIRASEKAPPSLSLLSEAVGLAVRLAPADSKTPRAVLALGQIFANAGNLTGARTHYSLILRQYQGAPEADRARTLIARSFFQEGNYEQASAWFRESWKKSSDPDTAAEARKLLAYSEFKKAEKRNSEGDGRGAALLFEEIAREFPESDVAQISLYNAGKLYRNSGMERKATDLFEQLAIRYEESGYATEALETSIKILEVLGDPIRAARDALLLADRSTGEARASAFARAADLFVTGNDPARAASTRASLLVQFPDPPDRTARQLVLLGRDYQAAGQWPKAQDAYRRVIALDKVNPGQEGIRRQAATAQLRLAEEALGRYQASAIAPPLDQSINRKRALLSETIAALVEAGGYKIAEISTAANFQIGQALESFKDAILQSPRPTGLTPEELEEYEAQLTELAYPFEEKARKAYLVNIERAVTLGLLDPWLIRSYERMAELAPWAYLREERTVFPRFLIPPPPLTPPSPPSAADLAARMKLPAPAGELTPPSPIPGGKP